MRPLFKFTLFFSLIFVCGCQEDAIEKKYKIGFSQCTTADSWRKNMHEGMTRELSFYPEMTMILTDAEGNNAQQIRQIQAFIDKKVDLIIASPNEALLEKNLADSTLSVEKLSQELGMSRVQLFRKISALTNKNVSDYIGDFKLQKAKALLKNSNKTIAEIAYETGFNNPSYFTTFFKQKTHQTPSDWRNG